MPGAPRLMTMTHSPRAPSTSFTVTIPTALMALLDKAILDGGFRDRSDFVATCNPRLPRHQG